ARLPPPQDRHADRRASVPGARAGLSRGAPGRDWARRPRNLPRMAIWDDVQRLALAMPQADERVSRGGRQWRVGDRLFVWERPLRPKEVEELGAAAPDGPILGARVEHLIAKEALLADDP